MESVYEALRVAAEAMDCDRPEEIIEDMGRYRIPDSETEVWSKVCEAVNQFRYDDVLEYLRSRG